MNQEILLAVPRGFCAGVERAIAIVNQAIDKLGAPVYVRHEVVHNKFVVEELKQKGAVFVQELDRIPDGSNVVFSAHGVSLAVAEQAKVKRLQVYDATCPLVTKVHRQVAKYARQAKEVILIGHAGHPEVEGTLGQYRGHNSNIYLVETIEDAQHIQPQLTDNLAYVTQTTLSIDDASKVIAVLKQRFPHIESPKKDDICYATQNRQNAVRDLAVSCDLVLIVGSPNSSNSNRLCELARKLGKTAYLIDNAHEINRQWLEGIKTIGISSGASAPEILVKKVINYLEQQGAHCASIKPRTSEKMKFPLPIALS